MKRWIKIIGLFISLSISCLAFQVAIADAGEPYDYYVPAPDRLLENVEKYHLNQGIGKIRSGHYKEAWPEFGFMLHYFPNHPKALQLISDLSMMMGNQEEALKYFEQATKLYPQHAATYGLWGVFLHKMNKLDKAIEKYEQALQLDSSSAEINYNLGLAFFAQKKYKEANQLAQKAYDHGYPLNGLRKKLQEAGAWKAAQSGSIPTNNQSPKTQL